MTPPTATTRRRPHNLVPHPEADRIPVMPEREYEAFRADVAARGVQVPIEITAGGVVLDGRQRLRAARELEQATVPVRVVAVEDEVDHMLCAAILRRQLTASQRAALVVERDEYQRFRAAGRRRQRANLVQAPEGAPLPPRGKSRDEAGLWAGVCGRTVQDAATVREHDPELFERVRRDDISASTAARQVRRRLRDEGLAAPPPLPEGPFELIYADPPWPLGHPDSPHAPENHYPTMSVEEIKALNVPAAEDAVLFLWAVSSLLPEALAVMEAWGFECKTTIVWVKDWIGLGVWVRNRHELLLVGRRGNHPPPEREDRADSVIEAPRGRHSQKPDAAYELLERMYPPTLRSSSSSPAKRGPAGPPGATRSSDERTAPDRQRGRRTARRPRSWVREATRAGRLPHLQLGRYRRYQRSAIDAWLAEQRAPPGQRAQRAITVLR